jgi:hypothetical protein
MQWEYVLKIGRELYSVTRVGYAQKHSIFYMFGILLVKYSPKNIASKKQDLKAKKKSWYWLQFLIKDLGAYIL